MNPSLLLVAWLLVGLAALVLDLVRLVLIGMIGAHWRKNGAAWFLAACMLAILAGPIAAAWIVATLVHDSGERKRDES